MGITKAVTATLFLLLQLAATVASLRFPTFGTFREPASYFHHPPSSRCTLPARIFAEQGRGC